MSQVSVVDRTGGVWKDQHPDMRILAYHACRHRSFPFDPLGGRDDGRLRVLAGADVMSHPSVRSARIQFHPDTLRSAEVSR